MNWKLAQRAEKMNPSVIREILKVTEKPGIISFAGGLPSPQTFPIDAMREASERVLRDDGKAALQYAASEGYGPLREWVAQDLLKQGMHVSPNQVLITTKLCASSLSRSVSPELYPGSSRQRARIDTARQEQRKAHGIDQA